MAKNDKSKKEAKSNGFFKGVKTELKKVVWPTRKQLIKNTALVLILVVAFAVIILSFDMIVDFLNIKLWNFITLKIS
ncbi:MAG: preprotein translocase subunit SecE [Clostridia bacterium]